MAYDPSSRRMRQLAAIKRHLPHCPGGVGLTTAMTMLKPGWIIVGSMPSADGTARTRDQGCLIVLNPQGKVVKTFSGPHINGPWGNMAVIDHGSKATLFISNVGFGIGAPGQKARHKATVLRVNLTIPQGRRPRITHVTVIGSGFGGKADADVFVIGPTGLALSKNGTLYVSDAIGNRISAIPDAAPRTGSAGQGKTITAGHMLHRPLAMTRAANGHLLVTNGLNGEVVEVNPATGQQLGGRWIDNDAAQTPPGSGDLFGIAMAPGGDGVYYVADDNNTLWEAR